MSINFDTISNFFQGSSLGKLAGNFSKTAAEFGKVLYRDGSNVMTGPLDMNSRRILNVPDPVDGNDVVNLRSVKNIAESISQGPPGPANSTFVTRDSLVNAPASNRSYIFAPVNDIDEGLKSGTFFYRTDEAPYIEDNVRIVKLASVPLSVGALVRQDAESVAITHPLGAPAYTKLLGDLVGQTVPVTLFCAADGSRDDGQNFQELLDKRPAQIDYAPGREVATTRQIDLRSNTRHRFERGSGILGDVSDYVIRGFGLTSGNLGVVQAPIVRRTKDMQLNNTSGEPLAFGDMILIADLTDPANIVNEVQIVQVVNGTLLRMRDKFNVDMPNPANIRVYKVYSPVQNVQFDGYGRISNVNANGGGGVRLNLTRDIRMRKTLLEEIRYIGLAIEGSIGFRGMEITMNDIEASGIGMRVAKNLNFSDIVATNIKSDEAFTAFDNVLGCNVLNMQIHQYLFGDDPDGGTAGNNVLLDKLCADFNFTNLICRGSATYNFFVNDRSENVSVNNYSFGLSNLGGARVANNCRNVKFGAGTVEDVINTVHPASGFGAASGQPCAGIMIDPDSVSCSVSGAVDFDRIASGRSIIDRQAVPDRGEAFTAKLASGVDRAVHGVTSLGDVGAVSPNFVGPNDPAGRSPTGNVVTMGADADRVWLQGGQTGGTAPSPLYLNPFGGTIVHKLLSFANNGEATSYGLGPGEWYRNTSNNNAVTEVV